MGTPRRRHGPLVKWLRQRPLTPLTSVRIRYGSPFNEKFIGLLLYHTVAIQQLVLIRARVHPFPSRTRKLSSLLPTILGWRRPGKIGSANTKEDIRMDVLFCCTMRCMLTYAPEGRCDREGRPSFRYFAFSFQSHDLRHGEPLFVYAALSCCCCMARAQVQRGACVVSAAAGGSAFTPL